MVKSSVTGGFGQSKREFKADLETKILSQLEKIVIPEISRDIKKLFEKTFVGWRGGNRPQGSQIARPTTGLDLGKRVAHATPSVFIEHDVTINVDDDGAHIKFNIQATVVYNGTQVPHTLWYWLDFGTQDGTWNHAYPSAWFPVATERTHPNTLHVDSTTHYNSGGQDRWISKRAKVDNGILYVRYFAGDKKKGIEKRNWSELVAKEVKKSNPDWDVTYTVRNPIK